MKRNAVLIMLGLLFSVGTALASSGGSYGLDWFNIGGNSASMNGGTFSLVGTLSQTESKVLSGGNYNLSGSFLGEPISSTRNKVFLPIVIKK